MHMNFPIKTRELLRFCFLAFCCYALFILFFAYWYYVTDSIELTPYANHPQGKLDFSQAIYFSMNHPLTGEFLEFTSRMPRGFMTLGEKEEKYK